MGSGTPAKRPSGRDRFGEPRDATVPPNRRAITGWCLDLMVARPRASKDLMRSSCLRWALHEGRGSTGGKRRQLRHASVDVELVTAELDHLAEEAVDGVRINPRISLLSEIEEYF